MNGTLKFAVISGSKLVKRSNDGIFCVLSVGGESVMTTVVKETQNPEFENEFSLKLKLWYSDELVVKVTNKVKDSEYDIGYVSVPLKDALSTGFEQTEEVDVMKPEKIYSLTESPPTPRARRCFAGKIKVKLHWIPEAQDVLDKSVSTLAGQRPKLLRGGFYYDYAKGTYSVVRDFPIVSKITPFFEKTLDKVVGVSVRATGIKLEPEERAPIPELQTPSTEPTSNIQLLNRRLENMIGYIDEKIDGAKDSVLYGAKRGKDNVKYFAADHTEVVVGHLQTAQEYLLSTRVVDLGCKGYEKVQPWIQPIPVVGRLFKPVNKENAPESLAEATSAVKDGMPPARPSTPPAVPKPTGDHLSAPKNPKQLQSETPAWLKKERKLAKKQPSAHT